MNKNNKSIDNCLDIQDTGKRLGYTSINTIKQLIKTTVFPNAFKVARKWYIPISDIEAYEQCFNTDNCLDAKETAEIFGYKTEKYLLPLVRKNMFPNAFKINHKWWIPIKDIETFKKSTNNVNNLDTKEATLNLGYKSAGKVNKLIKEKKFPNAFLLNGKWWIPIKDIEAFKLTKSYKSMKSLSQEKYLTVKELTNNLGLSKSYILYLIQKKKFLNAFKVNHQWRIPYSDFETFKNLHKKSNYNIDECLTSDELAQKLGYDKSYIINKFIKSEKFPNAFLLKGKWWIPIKDIEAYEQSAFLSDSFYEEKREKRLSNRTNNNPIKKNNCLNIKELKEKLGYKSRYGINQLIQSNKFPNAFKYKGKWLIPISDIEMFQKQTETSNCLNINETTNRLGFKSKTHITKLINKGEFPNTFKVNRKWWIPIKDIEDYEQRYNTNNCLDLKETANRLGYNSISTFSNQMIKKNFPHAFKNKKKWFIPLNDIKTYQLYKNSLASSKKKIQTPAPDLSLKDNCLSIQQTSKRLGYKSNCTVRKLVKKGEFPNIRRIYQQWWIPISDIESYEKKLNLPLNYLNTKEASKRLKRCQPVITLMISKNKFPNALKQNGKLFIPLKDIEDFEFNEEKSKLKIDFTGKLGFQEITKFLNTIEHKKELQETKKLFHDYCLLQTNKISGSSSYIRNRVSLFIRFYGNLHSVINKEIYLLEPNTIDSLLNNNSPLRKDQKKIFSRFLKYSYTIKNINPDEEIIISKKYSKTEDKDIYTPDVFYKVYGYIKDIKTHTKKSIKNRYYANMWVYTILLMTDFIRGQDLILNTPNINLDNLKINNFDWFLKNKLSDFQAQSVINQLYIHYRHKRTSKTKELLTFVVSPDLVNPLATSLVISELHRKIDGAEMLLDTFFEGIYNNIKTEGKERHKRFFNTPELKGFRFGSQKMNNSVGTYLFYSITEEDGYDSELALQLTQTARSHKKPETTGIYIQATNKDGSINRVSYNLFKRGHFGWLYNYLILYVSQNKQLNTTLEERTKLIEGIRKEISPKELEDLSQFIENHQTLIPLNDKSNTITNYLTSIYQKRRSVISKLQKFTHKEIKEILKNLAKGNMPSKHENAQCLIYPKCLNPQLVKCYSCEFVIPKNMLLIQLNEELNRFIGCIGSYKNETLILKDTKFLLHVLLIWKEARLAFGEETVNAFIPTNKTWKKINNIAHKLHIE